MRLLPLKLLAAAALLVLAGAASVVRADTITRSFSPKGNIQPGQVVALVINDKNSVELAPANDPTRIYGVAVDPAAPPITASQSGLKVFVVTAGVYPVLVSSQNGPIKAGDYLSMSSTDGTAARLKGQTFVLGRATENFDGTSGSTGKISVAIAPGKNPLLSEDTAVPTILRRLGESIAGKPVSSARIYAALGIFLITASVAFSLLWVGIRSGMVAIGRNPLSRHSIMQSLAQVIIASAIIFVGGLFGIYLFLRI